MLKNCFLISQDDGSDLKLDFTFDAELASLREESDSNPKSLSEAPKTLGLHNQAVTGRRVQSPTSPATDLTLKIAAAKTVWDSLQSLPPVFEHA